MGRRPNALIGGFFRRGRKLNDNSNRYEHQCTKCGELFPKGRIDAMLAHLVKRCPNMTHENRHLVFQHMHASSSGNRARQRQAQHNGQAQETDTPDAVSQQMHFHIPVDGHQGMHSDMQQRMHPDMPLDLLMLQRQQSALDTLAEVSRRHNDFAELRSMPQMGSQADILMADDQALFQALQRQAAGQTAEHTAINNAAMTSFSAFEPQAQPSATDFMLADNISSLPLVQAATAANCELAQTQPQQSPLNHNSSIDPQLAGHFDGTPTQLPGDSAASQPDFMAWTDTPQDFVTQQIPPTNQPAAGFTPFQNPQRSHARARFNDDRRKQVQGIRKRGACIRCRMLKKPCSEGTPCKTCQQVDTARLWKGACLRTRIADEFTLFSTSYFALLAKNERESVAPAGVPSGRMPGRLEVKLLPQSNSAITFAVTRQAVPKSDGNSIDMNFDPDVTADDEISMLDEGELIPEKISTYCSDDATISAYIENERNDFLKSTLQEAVKLLTSEAAAELSHTQKAGNSRANHISPSQLLRQVVELWIETTILASSTRSTDNMHICHNPSADPTQHLEPFNASSANAPSPTSASYRLIRSQLLAATETRCHRLSKTVLNELERRLLQRQQVSTFPTFIAAVVLLNCVERMTALYHTLDRPTPTELSPRTTWPLETPPAVFLLQGPRFASLLTTLLRMRALPPTTTRTDDGYLAVVQAVALPVRLNGVSTRDAGQAEEAARRAAAWLDPLALDVDDLIRRRYGGGNGSEGWRGWDGVFVAGVVLPEGS